jgi:hypothetical protein
MSRLFVVAGLLAASIASASAVFQQPVLWTGSGANIGTARTSHLDTGGDGYQTYDNFTLSSAATINQATWEGVYLTLPNNTDGASNTTTWAIGIYADNGGIPGTLLSGTTLPSADVSSVVLGTGTFDGNTVTVYQFTANLTSFNAAPGTQYWFSPLSEATDFSPYFTWIAGTGGDNASYQIGEGTANGVSNDRAFSLSTVLEPSTLYLGGVFLAALVLSRKARTRDGSLSHP